MTNEQLLRTIESRLNRVDSEVESIKGVIRAMAENNTGEAVADLQRRLNDANAKIRKLEYELYLNGIKYEDIE